MVGHLNPIEEEAITKLKALLNQKLGNNLNSVLLYGSKARGDYDNDSDIDILVVAYTVTPEVKDIIRDVVLDIQLEYSLPVSAHIRSLDYFTVQQNNKLNLFIHNIDREGIRV
ncbi:MAG: nucleotidyltransferase domain-containing protein [Ruminiclostridium sp.]|nr:nucleotidyltransferase domain-containing protein [Ruminiclostridium sp.]